MNVWRLDLRTPSGPNNAAPKSSLIISSTLLDLNGQFSPDEKRMVFQSDRSGDSEIWACDSDGLNPVQLTSLRAHTGSPRWSPDGESIAFDSNKEGQFEVFVMSANGAGAKRLTNNPALDAVPSWSRDGKRIYFASDRSGRFEIWKVSRDGGAAVQVTRQGGFVGIESHDGKSLFYTKVDGRSGLWEAAAGGGDERQIIDLVIFRAFAVTREGIYFLTESAGASGASLQFFSFATGKKRAIATTSGGVFQGLSVSSNAQSILYSQLDQRVADLMLIEGFR